MAIISYIKSDLIDILTKQFLKCYKPGESQSIDESMVKFKEGKDFGSTCQKPIKRGYKIWICADQSGFASEFQIYNGKVETTEKI
ncbi:hypothetical protein NQ314_006360 [Rhamnusium bicolor]|uniref:PiggyBac transposable element-derived protein domain-containing protein n=1 Tax=Rhamnusium bicolor TaxID=1586634 RepID=A0AAV8Z694_9CUCU|nr:hypothetical protein NQ314_006360 [Rhamnusium bicolor]